jgi:hypothetical protein
VLDRVAEVVPPCEYRFLDDRFGEIAHRNSYLRVSNP